MKWMWGGETNKDRAKNTVIDMFEAAKLQALKDIEIGAPWVQEFTKEFESYPLALGEEDKEKQLSEREQKNTRWVEVPNEERKGDVRWKKVSIDKEEKIESRTIAAKPTKDDLTSAVNDALPERLYQAMISSLHDFSLQSAKRTSTLKEEAEAEAQKQEEMDVKSEKHEEATVEEAEVAEKKENLLTTTKEKMAILEKSVKDLQIQQKEEALEALKELDSSHFLKNDNSKKYYSALTEIIKRYLHREVDDSALESTSNELIERLILHRNAGNFEFDADTIKKLESIFKRADLIKFAKMREQEGQAKVDRSVVEEIINETKEIIPEPTEEELLQDKLYLEKLQKKQQRRKQIKIALGIFIGIVLVGVVFGAIKGFDELKDKTIGNEVRSLSEGRWIKSEYGTPLVIIETPKVLVRTPTDSSISRNPLIKETHAFTYGTLQDKLLVKVSTLQFKQEQEIDLDKALDAALTILESAGAKNLVVKRDDFETEKGIKGVKAYGDFQVQVSEKKVLKVKSNYELLIFAQGNGLQKVLVVYQDDGKYSEAIKDRIISSIELEVTEQKKKDGQ